MTHTVIRVGRTATVAQPIEEVFSRLVDVSAYGSWMPRTGLFGSSRLLGAASPRLGAGYRDSSRIGPWEGTITAITPPTRVEFRQRLRWFGRDVMEARLSYVLERDGHATKVRHLAEGELFGIFRAMRPMTVLLAKRERRLVLDALRMSFERPAEVDPKGNRPAAPAGS